MLGVVLVPSAAPALQNGDRTASLCCVRSRRLAGCHLNLVDNRSSGRWRAARARRLWRAYRVNSAAAARAVCTYVGGATDDNRNRQLLRSRACHCAVKCHRYPPSRLSHLYVGWFAWIQGGGAVPEFWVDQSRRTK